VGERGRKQVGLRTGLEENDGRLVTNKSGNGQRGRGDLGLGRTLVWLDLGALLLLLLVARERYRDCFRKD
jgi:hypothetical protein